MTRDAMVLVEGWGQCVCDDSTKTFELKGLTKGSEMTQICVPSFMDGP